jgi:hypothetical protein
MRNARLVAYSTADYVKTQSTMVASVQVPGVHCLEIRIETGEDGVKLVVAHSCCLFAEITRHHAPSRIATQLWFLQRQPSLGCPAR